MGHATHFSGPPPARLRNGACMDRRPHVDPTDVHHQSSRKCTGKRRTFKLLCLADPVTRRPAKGRSRARPLNRRPQPPPLRGSTRPTTKLHSPFDARGRAICSSASALMTVGHRLLWPWGTTPASASNLDADAGENVRERLTGKAGWFDRAGPVLQPTGRRC